MPGGENVRLGITSDRVVHIVAEKTSGDQQDSEKTMVQRALPLPDSVDETKVLASFNEGQLTMNMPKKVETTNQQAIGAC
eukprot:scaffold665784_cov59-Prasinocladus_malaysianus.AAC.1